MKKLFFLVCCITLLITIIGCELNLPENSQESSSAFHTSSEVFESSKVSTDVSDESEVSDDASMPAVKKDEYYEGYCGSEKTLVLKLENGKEKDQVSIYENFAFLAPEDFLIFNDEFHILDSVADRIAVFDGSGTFLREIVFDEYADLGTPILLAYNGNTYAVLYYVSYQEPDPNKWNADILFIMPDGTKHIISFEESLKDGIKYPSEFTLSRMYFEGDVLHLLKHSRHFISGISSDGDKYLEEIKPDFTYARNTYEDDDVLLTFSTEHETTIVKRDAISEKTASLDVEYASDGYVYVGEFYQFASVPHDWRLNEIRISKYETDGTLVSYAIVDMPFGVFGPDKDFYISPDAKVYHMRYDLDALYIYEIEMGNTAISTALYLYNQYKEQ